MPSAKALLPQAVFLQITGIIGSGLFVLPFLFSTVSYYLFFPVLFLSFLASFIANRFYIDIILATSGDHQLSGYTQIYLGAKYKFLVFFNLILLALGAIFAYEKLFITFTRIFFPISSFYIFLIFFFFTSAVHLSQSKISKKYSGLISFLVFLIPLVLFIASLNYPISSFTAIPATGDFGFFGVLLFSLSGFTILPEIEELLRGQIRLHRILPRASIIGLALTVLIYLLFIFGVTRLSGSHLTADSVTGIFFSHPTLGRLVAFLGLVVTIQATLNFTLILRELFFRDFHFVKKSADILSLSFLFLPLTLFGFSFIRVISLIGTVTIFISTFIICLIRQKLPRNILVDVLTVTEIIILYLAVLIVILSP